MRAAVSHELSPPPPPRPARNRRGEGLFSVLLLVLALAILVSCRFCAPFPIQRWFMSMPFENPLDLLFLVCAALTAMLLHELGHLLASVALGFKLLGVSLGPLQLQMLHGTCNISLRRRNFFIGAVSAIPQTLHGWRTAMLIVVASGPMATFGTMLFAASLKATNHPSVIFQMAFIQISTLLFVLGFIPNGRHSSAPNDARLLFDLARQSKGAEEMELNVLLSQQVLAGTRPQDYPQDLITRLAAWRGRPESQYAFSQAVVRWALDSDYFQLAESWDRRALALSQQCSVRYQNTALASSACFDVIFREDLPSARNKFAKVDFKALFPKCFELRARASHQFALGRVHRVGGFVIRAQYALPRGIPAYDLERTLLAKLHMKALPSTLLPHHAKQQVAASA